MARSQHEVTRRIDEARARLEQHGLDVTPANVKANVNIAYREWPVERAIDEALMARIRRRLRECGYVIADTKSRVRKSFWDSNISELEEQLEIKTKSNVQDENRLRADRAVLALLREKRDEMGYEVYPGLFQGDIERIYAMHGIAAPAEVAA